MNHHSSASCHPPATLLPRHHAHHSLTGKALPAHTSRPQDLPSLCLSPPSPHSPGVNTAAFPGRSQLSCSQGTVPLTARLPYPAWNTGDFHPQLSPSLILLKSAKVQLNVWPSNVQFLTVLLFKYRAASTPGSHLLVPL